MPSLLAGVGQLSQLSKLCSTVNTYLFDKSFPPQTAFLVSKLTPRLYDWTVSSEHLGFFVLVFFITIFVWFRAAD